MRQEREQFWNKGMREGRRQGIQEGMQKGIQEGIQKGIREGITQSEQKLLWNPIQKKLARGKSISQIAEELESTEEEIQAVIEKINRKIQLKK